LVAALSGMLKAGPKDAAEMMVRGPFLSNNINDTKALDALTTDPKLGGLAWFDGAFIRSINPPSGLEGEANAAAEEPKKYFLEVARRFDRAAQALKDPAHKADAKERAAAARATAAAIGGPKQ
jgi:hypothetical protein